MTEQVSQEPRATDGSASQEATAESGPPRNWVFGLRAGIAIPTQKVIYDFGDSTSVGPLVNDIPVTRGVALNMELGWNHNSCDYQLSTMRTTTGFNASTLNLLF